MRNCLLFVVALLVCAIAGLAGGAEQPTTLAELLDSLGVSSAADLPKAIADIASSGDDARQALPALVSFLDDEDPDIRAAAATVIGRIGHYDKAAVDRLIRAFDDRGEPRRGGMVCYFAADAVGRLGARCVPVLTKLLSSENVQKRRCAGLALGRIGPEAEPAVDALTAMLLEDADKTRTIAIYALSRIGPKAGPTLPHLIRGLSHSDFHTQYWSCRAIAAIGSPGALEAVPKLIELVSEGNASVRRNAAAALGNIGPDVGERAITPLIERLDDPVHDVRRSSAIALGRLGPLAKQSVPALKVIATDRQSSTRAQAAGALWQVTGTPEPGMTILLGELQRKSTPWEAAQAFERLGAAGKPAVAQLTKLVGADDVETQVFATMALAGIGPAASDALATLRTLAESNDGDMRDLARLAIDAIEPPK